MVRHHDDASVFVIRVDQQLVEELVVGGENQTVGVHNLPTLAENLAVRESFLLPEIFHVWLSGWRLTRLFRAFVTNEMIRTRKVDRKKILARLNFHLSLRNGVVSEIEILFVVLVSFGVVFVLGHPVRAEGLVPEGHRVDVLLRGHRLQAGQYWVPERAENHVLKPE